MFQERFRVEGGKFFDEETMKATVNSDIGVKVFTDMRAENAFMPPGVETWGFVENLAAFLAGDTAMTISWPPYGRWAAGYGTDEEALSWVPKSTIAGKVGYALPPGGHPQLAAGFSLGVSSSSRNKEAAYLFIQWLNSKDISLERVQLPYALRDPFRASHFASEEYKSRWPEAPEYLATLREGRGRPACSTSRCSQTDKYEEAPAPGHLAPLGGRGPARRSSTTSRRSGTRSPSRSGVEAQRDAYHDWASKPNAYPQEN